MEQKDTISPAQFARATGQSLHRVYALLWEGRLSAEKVDGVWQIDKSELEKRQKVESA